MASKLVIVESPAKAKTIGSYLGKDFEVEASVGHIRDLPENGSKLDPELKKKWWAQYAVDVDNDFEPIYEITSEKHDQVRRLKQAMKGKDTLVLATDEDREGESISWHLLEVLKPPKSVKVERIAFHEITKEAIIHALSHPRAIDYDLVEAQEARRILDRLFGYTLSPVLWTKLQRNLSAGRVQTPAVKLIVDREKERLKFQSASYWDLTAELAIKGEAFSAVLKRIGGESIASGADFDGTTGQLKPSKNKVRLLGKQEAEALAPAAAASKPWTVVSIEEKEQAENPMPPFMTTTLQQEGSRKFGWSPDHTMRVAQTLYEGVSAKGEQIGLITYMRTDSLNLADAAVKSIRKYIEGHYPDSLPDRANVYRSKVRNAQEAHEAIRPTDVERTPDAVRSWLNADQAKLYDLIWKRTVACQMKSAKVLRTAVEIESTTGGSVLTFQANGRQILFQGCRQVYEVGKDDSDQESGAILPRLQKGQVLDCTEVNAEGHETRPPARYTEATLIKALESHGVGRPSTYASILSVIGPTRGYVRKSGRQLVPTFKAFLVMEILDGSFEEFSSLDFTRRMDESLDEIAEGKMKRADYLKRFYLGEAGLKTVIDERKESIPFPAFVLGDHPETGEPIIVRLNKEGKAFLQLGPREAKKFASVPDDVPPGDLTMEKALELLSGAKPEAASIGVDPITGQRLLLKNRSGFYLQVEQTEAEIARKEKPRFISLPADESPYDLSPEDLDALCCLPRSIGNHPESGTPIVFKMGKFGAYVECGTERRTLANWRDGITMTVEEGVKALAAPKGRPAVKGPAVIKDLGTIEGCAGPVRVLSGRFGPYVTDGTTNATLPKGTDPAALSVEDAQALLEKKREAGPSTGGRRKPMRRPAARKAGTTAKKTTRRKA